MSRAYMEYTFIPRIQKNRENVEFLHSHHHLMCRDRALKFIKCHIPNLFSHLTKYGLCILYRYLDIKVGSELIFRC